MRNTYSLSLVLIVTVILLLPAAKAQEVDHVYLKNGSLIRGKIVEIEPENHVKIQDLCGNVWNYEIGQVEKITSEPFTQGARETKPPLEFKEGFVNMTSIGFLAGSPNNARVAPFSLQMVNGWRSNMGLFTGAGIGIEFLNSNYMPLFLDVRYDLFGRDVVPYIVARGGYSVPLARDREEYDIVYTYSGGPCVAAGFGLKIKSRNHFAWDITLMYRYQKTSYEEKYDWNNQEYSYTDVYNRMEIRLGFYID